MRIGIKKRRKNGDVTETTTSMDKTLKANLTELLNVSGILFSVQSISLLNL